MSLSPNIYSADDVRGFLLCMLWCCKWQLTCIDESERLALIAGPMRKP